MSVKGWMGNQADQAELDRRRRRLDSAQNRLLDAVARACPGTHRPVQHRDRKPPWCKECGRTTYGQHVVNPTSTEG